MEIKCVVCGEPWYLPLSDSMEKWEVKLFKAGAGCPGCKGVEPDPAWHPQEFTDVENGDEDPIDRIIAYENRDNRPAWREP